MRLLKSKKGIGESIITDVLSLLAYFLVFFIVIFLITTTDAKSKADVKVEEMKVDLNLEILNGLRTVVTLEDGTNVTFAEFIAEYADTPLCNPDGTANTIHYKNFYDQVMVQMKPYFESLKRRGACITISFGSDIPPKFAEGILGQCDQSDYVASYIKDQHLCTGKPFKGNIVFPTKQKRIVTVEINSEP